MKRLTYVLFLSLSSLCFSQSAWAGFVLSAAPTTAEYTPGTPLLVDILLTSPTGGDQLSDYSIDITLGSTSGAAGTDFKFGSVIETSEFAFAPNNLGGLNYSLGLQSRLSPSGNPSIINISAAILFRFGGPGAIDAVDPGTSFNLGRVEILTSPTAGELSLTFGPTIEIRDYFRASTNDGFLDITSESLRVSQAAGGGGNATVPEPLSLCVWSILGLAGLVQKPLRKLKAHLGRTPVRAVA